MQHARLRTSPTVIIVQRQPATKLTRRTLGSGCEDQRRREAQASKPTIPKVLTGHDHAGVTPSAPYIMSAVAAFPAELLCPLLSLPEPIRRAMTAMTG